MGKLPVAKSSIVPIVLVLAFGAILICSALFSIFSKKEEEVFSDHGDYIFDTITILESISKGNSDGFLETEELPEASLPYTGLVHWNSADFLLIAQSFHKFKWKESIDQWNLYSISYFYDCHDFNNGPLGATFSLYKFHLGFDNFSRLTHTMIVGLLNPGITWTEAEKQPVVEYWKSINLSQIYISAEDAIKIAESNGGMETRLKVSNECVIYLNLAPTGIYKGWSVKYTRYDSFDRLMQFDIDVNTGVFNIIYPIPE